MGQRKIYPVDERRVYPEIARLMRATTYMAPDYSTYEVKPQPIPDFPKNCPACGAGASDNERTYYSPMTYACGGAYVFKPQIQNHTDKWWGACPGKES
jgi:hypothetical protein